MSKTTYIFFVIVSILLISCTSTRKYIKPKEYLFSSDRVFDQSFDSVSKRLSEWLSINNFTNKISTNDSNKSGRELYITCNEDITILSGVKFAVLHGYKVSKRYFDCGISKNIEQVARNLQLSLLLKGNDKTCKLEIMLIFKNPFPDIEGEVYCLSTGLLETEIFTYIGSKKFWKK
ncbi:MAG: hypothetical protein NT007_14985 [Candidatus Kapabacteria bacterium]|nr:hypothetical protein [Candidatus Kapabacteria bacterium]